MTWTKLGSEYFEQIALAGLSDAAFRTHAEAIGWVYGIEDPELRIPHRLVRRFAESPDYEAAVVELVQLGFWASNGADYFVVHHADVIRESLVAQHKKRDRDRRAQESSRRRARADVSTDSPTDRPTDVGASNSAAPRQTDRQTDREEEHHEEVLNGTRWRISGTRI